MTRYECHSAVVPGASSVRARGLVPAAGAGLAGPLLLPVFAGTLFLSALLMFLLQPMFTKMVLPLLGGAPNVWITAML